MIDTIDKLQRTNKSKSCLQKGVVQENERIASLHPKAVIACLKTMLKFLIKVSEEGIKLL